MVIGLLESIKLYLGSRKCIFIFGLDDTAVVNSLGRFWQGRGGDDNREYLEKLFQATIHVPLPKKTKIKGFIEGQLKAHGFPGHDECAGHVEQLIEPNPRKIKNFLNSLCATWNLMAHETPDPYHAKKFILFSTSGCIISRSGGFWRGNPGP